MSVYKCLSVCLSVNLDGFNGTLLIPSEFTGAPLTPSRFTTFTDIPLKITGPKSTGIPHKMKASTIQFTIDTLQCNAVNFSLPRRYGIDMS